LTRASLGPFSSWRWLTALPCRAVLTAGVNTADHTAAFEHLCDTIEVCNGSLVRYGCGSLGGFDAYTSRPRVLRALRGVAAKCGLGASLLSLLNWLRQMGFGSVLVVYLYGSAQNV
jgi:hypothetical protein